MNTRTKTLGALAAGLLLITGCGSGDEPEASDSSTEDPFENIPDDAPIHDLEDEEDVFRHMFDCDDSESVEECEQRFVDGVADSALDGYIRDCEESVAQYEEFGAAMLPCFHGSSDVDEFSDLFEERTGTALPDELRTDAEQWGGDYSDSEPEPEEDTAGADDSGAESGGSWVDELYVDIDSLGDCEEAHIIWGGMMNAELEGLETDGQYLADLEDWMAGNACW